MPKLDRRALRSTCRSCRHPPIASIWNISILENRPLSGEHLRPALYRRRWLGLLYLQDNKICIFKDKGALRIDHPAPDRKKRHVDCRMKVKLAHRGSPVRVDGFDADIQLGGDALVRFPHTFADQRIALAAITVNWLEDLFPRAAVKKSKR